MKNTIAVLLLAWAAGSMAQALPDTSPAAVWRATSRLGYGPTPDTLTLASSSAKAWSLVQVEAAYQASQRPATVPAALAAITTSADEVTRLFHAEREARREGRASLQRPPEGSRPARDSVPAHLAAMLQSSDPEDYSRMMAQSAVAWRVLSCSDSQIEHPLLARMLTGWSVDIRGSKAFLFRPRAHEPGPKTLMGRTFSSQGQQQGIEAIRFLASHPATALRISTRIATFFVADKPPAELVDRLRRNFLETGGDLRSLMRTLIESPQFWDAQHTLFKTPQDFACSALAAAGPIGDGQLAVQAIRQTVGFLGQTGQSALRWPTPDGYKTDANTWLAPEALTRRADYAFTLATRMPEPDYLNAFFSPATRDRIRQERNASMRIGLALSGPEFMMK